ncbi:bifunctional histidinol-phosphatase/imidazoleglycerol-phosphate dehydratase HisB [Myroides sp. LJL119]
MKQKVLFIDRDGTILKEPEDFQIDSFSKMSFLKGCIVYLSKIATELDYKLVLVTNQDGLGTSSFASEDFWPVQNLMIDILKGQGIVFQDIYIDSSLPEDKSNNRKPNLGMLSKYVYGNYDLQNSYVIGDRLTDVLLANNLNSKAILIQDPTLSNIDCELTTLQWQEIYNYLKALPRVGSCFRQTKETTVLVKVNLDSSSMCEIQTGLGFFNHMLEQINKHGQIGLDIQVKGDLHVDQHHSIEDTALALGSAFAMALSTKKGIERYGFVLPMDDALAQVAIDFSGRCALVWDVEFKREIIGDMPCEMFEHFFKSFCDTAKCNLNIQATGSNEHHKIESIFKCFAKALNMAIKKGSNYQIPSTKGVL